jgi:capsular polysaccharide export protein
MHELVDQVYSALEKYNHKYNQDHWLVIKEHPSDFGRINYNGLKKKYKNKKVIFTTTLPSSELIESSRAVITINSTVGIEALLKGKPVITLGEAFYNVEGLVHHCIDLSRLQDDMWNAVSEKMNSGLVDKFLYYLRYQYLVEIDKKNLTKENIVPVLNKISEVSGEK